MLWNRNRNQIIEDWQESLDYSLEAGDTPLFDIGLSHNTLDGLLSLVAVQDFSKLPRPTLIYPILTIGGNSPLWLLTLDRYRQKFMDMGGTESAAISSHVPSYTFDTTFTAVDPATHMASLTVNAGPSRNIISRSPKARATGLPAALRALTFPQLEPAVISTWQALPLTISLPKPQLRMLHSVQHSAQSTVASSDQIRGYLPQQFTISEDSRTAVLESAEGEATLPTAGAKKPIVDSDEWISVVALVACLLLILLALV